MENNTKTLDDRPLVSLCIPTNGVVEWVVPVIDSIISQLNENNNDKIEIVIEDNGDNKFFREVIKTYQERYSVLNYFKSNSDGFMCQIDCFNDARGHFIKLINHRAMIKEGMLDYLIDVISREINLKSVIFFSNGHVPDRVCSDFDEFVCNLSYWSSWSGGLGFWKDNINLKELNTNVFFPHLCVLFSNKKHNKYIIDGKRIFDEVEKGHAKKSTYNIFYVFGVVYPAILSSLIIDESINIETFNSIKKALEGFLIDQHINFKLLKHTASYDLTHEKDYMSAYFEWKTFKRKIFIRFFQRALKKIVSK